MRLIRKLDSGGVVWEDGDLTGRIKTLAVLLMDHEDSCVVEVTETSTAQVDRMLHRDVFHEPSEVLDPRIVIVPEE